MASIYTRMRKIYTRWPSDMSKDGRDFSQHLRKKFLSVCKDGEETKLDVKYWEPRVAALERLMEDVHMNNNKPRLPYETASKKPLEVCHDRVSNEWIINEARLMRKDIRSKIDSMDSKKIESK